MSSSCGADHNFDGADPRFRRALIIVVMINLSMFFVEMAAGKLAGSQALQADALDFLADSVTYMVSFAVIGKSLRTRGLAALGKGASLMLMGLWVMGETIYNVFVLQLPKAEVMGLIGALALAANLISVVLLMAWRNGDANVRSVWLCSRNDAIGNVAVMLAAVGVFETGAAWPDLLVAAIMAALFLSSSVQIIRQSLGELKGAESKHKAKCC